MATTTAPTTAPAELAIYLAPPAIDSGLTLLESAVDEYFKVPTRDWTVRSLGEEQLIHWFMLLLPEVVAVETDGAKPEVAGFRQRIHRLSTKRFRLHMSQISNIELRSFWKQHPVLEERYPLVPPEEAERLGLARERKFRKVQFEEILWCLGPQILIRHGWAYLDITRYTIDILQSFFISFLAIKSEQLQKCFRMMKPKDERLVSLSNLAWKKHLITSMPPAVSCSNRNVSIADVVPLMPPCMIRIMKFLERRKHLKDDGRRMLVLYFKDSGVSFADVYEYFRKQFCSTSSLTPETFDRTYGYNIRHAFGLEGSRRTYRSLTCAQIQNLAKPTTDTCHGCPFKPTHRTNLMINKEIPDIEELAVIKASQNRYSEACYLHLQSIHPCETEKPMHPLLWNEIINNSSSSS